jgi:hypothetical protein
MMVEPTEADLQDERDFLLRSLVDLDAELAAGDIDQLDYLSIKDGYTARTATVLRALDELHGEPPDAASRPVPAAPKSRRRWVGPAVATAVAGVAVVAALLVSNGLGQRLPGGTLTGAITPTGPQATLAQARRDLSNGNFLDAVKAYDSVIRQDPGNPEALAYRGWILYLTGRQAKDPALVQRGLTSIRNAEVADPGYPEAHFFAGMILAQQNNSAAAADELRRALASNPPPALVPEIQGELRAVQSLAPTTTR